MSNIVTPNTPGFDYAMQAREASEARIAGLVTPIKSGTYTLVMEDMARVVSIGRAASSTLTVPTNSQVPFPIGTNVLVHRAAVGSVVIAGANGVTIDVLPTTTESVSIRQGWTAVLRKIGPDRWTQLGDLTLT